MAGEKIARETAKEERMAKLKNEVIFERLLRLSLLPFSV
jgi:hypothetical protein